MKSSLAFTILFLLPMFLSEIEARRGPEDYWKSVMKDEKMPEAITSLLNQDLADPISEDNNMLRSYFKRDFDVNPVNAIIYHPDHRHHHNQIPNWSTKHDSNRPAQPAGN